MPERAKVLIIGSGAGGATTALHLAREGVEVTVLEEGARHDASDYGQPMTRAMPRLYRRRGMTPILGRVPIGYVEGACLGGSTEINSGFWHRAPREVLLRWQARYALRGAGEDDLAPHYEWAEEALGVGKSELPWPPSTRAFARGIEAMGWSYQEVPRAAPGCRHTNACARGCPTGAKQGMSARILPDAERAGARVITNVRVLRLLHSGGRVDGVVATWRPPEGAEQLVRIDAEHVFVCAGPTETPALLLRSGIKRHVGNSLRIHPYLKVVARFDEVMDSERSVLPLVQVKEFWPELSLGGGYYTLGQLAMTLSDNWPENAERIAEHRHMAQYYVGVRGTGRGTVRPARLGSGTVVRYELSQEDLRRLSVGFARLSELLLAGGAQSVLPSVHGLASLQHESEAVRWLDDDLPKQALNLVTVHAFSSCPAGERPELCAVDSYGRVRGFDNLVASDASIIPDSPGVNPQGTVMALARRNAAAFLERQRASLTATGTA